MRKDVVPDLLNFVQNGAPPPKREGQLKAEPPAHFAQDRLTRLEKSPGSLYLKPHQLPEAVVQNPSAEITLSIPKTVKIFKRDVDPPLCHVDRNILPEICELEPGADTIGERNSCIIRLPENVEHKLADRIRRVIAVFKQFCEVTKGPFRYVHSKCLEKGRKGLAGNAGFRNSFRQCDENRVIGPTSETSIEFCLPFVDFSETLKWGDRPFVGKVVGSSGERIDAAHKWASIGWDKERCHRKILIVFPRHLLTVCKRALCIHPDPSDVL